MPQPLLPPEEHALCVSLIETFMAGHEKHRPDLSYPQSHSDMEAGMRAVMAKFEIKPRPAADGSGGLFGLKDGQLWHFDKVGDPIRPFTEEERLEGLRRLKAMGAK